MAVWGNQVQALRLARIGAVLAQAALDARGGGDANQLGYADDNVCNGASLALAVLRLVIDPACRLYGPGNFQITPTGGAAEIRQLGDPSILGRSMYGFGESPDQFWLASRIGLASSLAVSHSTGRAIARAAGHATDEERNAAAYRAVDTAAVVAEMIVRTNVAPLEPFAVAIQPAAGLENLHPESILVSV
ncbi:MAG TPA: hypothetical protein VLE99_05315 [Candidatus Saccharimonadales bacterium]|nr:hypothetical protein [Candidatus Saccharimonadales bacterium]